MEGFFLFSSSDTDVLTDEQSKWVKKATEQVYDLIKETPPNGAQFAKSVKHILQREEQWISWKNEGCPSFKPRVSPAAASLAKDGDDNNKPEANGKRKQRKILYTYPRYRVIQCVSFSILAAAVGSTRKRKRKVGDQIQDAIASKKFLMGNATLTRLWNKCPDNMEACSAPERDFLPELGTYFLEAIEQINPASGIDAEYKYVTICIWKMAVQNRVLSFFLCL